LKIRNENNCKSRLVQTLRREGSMTLAIHGHAMQQPGWPDVAFWNILSGKFNWVELKEGSGDLRNVQADWFRIAKELGIPAFVFRYTESKEGGYIGKISFNDEYMNFRFFPFDNRLTCVEMLSGHHLSWNETFSLFSPNAEKE